MRLVFWVGFWVFLLDQAIKWLVVHWLDLRTVQAIDVLPPFLNLRMAWNYGINFGLLGGPSDVTRWALIAVAVVVSVGVVWWVRHDPPGRLGFVAAGLMVGGAMGNVVDRVLYGAVADFLNMSCCGFENPYAFNVADISIFIGAVGLILFTGNDGKAKKAP